LASQAPFAVAGPAFFHPEPICFDIESIMAGFAGKRAALPPIPAAAPVPVTLAHSKLHAGTAVVVIFSRIQAAILVQGARVSV